MDRKETLMSIIKVIKENINWEDQTITLRGQIIDIILNELTLNLEEIISDEIEDVSNIIQVSRETFIKG
jgi:hypothetical protein